MRMIETGHILLAFTNTRHCKRCKNEKNWHIRQQYRKQSILGRIPISDQKTSVFIMCPVCENTEEVVRNIHAFYKHFISDQKWSDLHTLLESGKMYTKYWFDEKNEKDQTDILNRLNALKSYEMVKFLAS